MKRLPIFVLLLSVLILSFSLIPSSGFAQVVDPDCDPFDPACPIDGGLSLLIAAGIGLGAKKAYQERKKKIAEEKTGS